MIYNLALIPIIFLSLLYFIVVIANILNRNTFRFPVPKNADWPFVTVQIPVYNDPVAIRCVKKCLQFDYPKDKYEIVVADDSNDGVTTKLLERFGDKIKLVRRNFREGFKAGALNNAMKYSNGEIIVIFDSDFVPSKKFLKKIVSPFLQDENIAIVQSRMGFLNPDCNMITKFASTILMLFHHFICPFNDMIGTTFFCGTHGAIRRKALLEAGGWNEKSLTEDADLSIRILANGNKIKYLPYVKVSGEVPVTLDGFFKQQMRWSYGVTRAFIDNFKIIWSRKFTFLKKSWLTICTLFHGWAPFVVLLLITGILGWFVAPPKPIEVQDVIRFFSILVLTGGFFTAGLLSLYEEKRLHEWKSFIPAVFTLGLIYSTIIFIAFIKAISGKKMVWFRTPKSDSKNVLNCFKKHSKK